MGFVEKTSHALNTEHYPMLQGLRPAYKK